MSDNHRTRWTVEETQFLLAEFDHTRETTEVIADLLGRTPDATQQRYYEVMWGAQQGVLSKEQVASRENHPAAAYKPVNFDAPKTELCEHCFCYKPVKGNCCE